MRLMKALLLAVLLAPSFASAQTFTMSYQGRLLDANHAPVVGAPSITFSIHAAATGGTAIWSETQTVQLTNGFYAVQLGAVNPLGATVFDGGARWLGVKVASDPEMTPRQFIATVPYAFRAQNSAHAASADSATTAGRATTAGSAATAGSATTAGSADTAASADTAKNVAGGGTVSASSVTTGTLLTSGNGTFAGTLAAGNIVTGASPAVPGGVSTGSLSTSGGAVIGATLSAGAIVTTGSTVVSNGVSTGTLRTTGAATVGTNLTVTGNATINGTADIVAASMGSASATNANFTNATVTNLTVNGTASATGLVLGGGFIGHSSSYGNYSYTCNAWGAGRCSASSSTSTTAPMAVSCTRGTPIFPTSFFSSGPTKNVGEFLCIQGVAQ